MDYAAFIGVGSFICGIAVMFAIHRVVFDHYASQAEDYIEELKRQNRELIYGKDNIEVRHIHTYASPDDVLDLKFNDYLED